VTTIPTRRLPKKLVIGALHQEEIRLMEKAVEEDHVDEAGQRGQYLWIRGLTRLQHQVNRLNVHCVAEYFGQFFFAVVIDLWWILF